MSTQHYPSEAKMIADLNSINIEVRPVMMAFTPNSMGLDQMTVEKAYDQFVRNKQKHISDFRSKNNWVFDGIV